VSSNRQEFFEGLPPLPQDDRIKVQWAYDIGKMCHQGQYRDDGARYFEHVRAVAQLLIDHGYHSVEYLVIAFLHDTLEDTFLKLSLLEQVFGPEIARGILSVSKSYGVEDPLTGRIHRLPKKSLDEYFGQIKRFGRRAAVVKCADRIENLSDLLNPQPEGSRWTAEKRLKQVKETEEWILPLAEMYEPRFEEKLLGQCETIRKSVQEEMLQVSPNGDT
jgi:GTP diphosphokinase / guanosine-3',5'-bis(diphosphate) 3'-diphosphatase